MLSTSPRHLHWQSQLQEQQEEKNSSLKYSHILTILISINKKIKMDPTPIAESLQLDFSPLLRIYTSGRIERLLGTATVPASVDPTTNVTSKDITINPDTGLSARLYLPTINNNNNNNNKKLPVLVYFHGGGFCIESAFSPTYHVFLNSLASKAGLVVVSVNYRLAPEHPLPVAYHDSLEALKWSVSADSDPWLAEFGDFGRVFLSGDSAGANIAHHMAMDIDMALLDQGHKIEGIVLVHPYFWGTEPIGSETRDAKTRGFAEALWRLVNQQGTEVDVDHPKFNVFGKNAPSLKGLGCRRVLVAVAEKDLLVERGRAYCEALKESGWEGEVELVESRGEDHVFHLQRPECEKARELMEKMVSLFNGHN